MDGLSLGMLVLMDTLELLSYFCSALKSKELIFELRNLNCRYLKRYEIFWNRNEQANVGKSYMCIIVVVNIGVGIQNANNVVNIVFQIVKPEDIATHFEELCKS